MNIDSIAVNMTKVCGLWESRLHSLVSWSHLPFPLAVGSLCGIMNEMSHFKNALMSCSLVCMCCTVHGAALGGIDCMPQGHGIDCKFHGGPVIILKLGGGPKNGPKNCQHCSVVYYSVPS